MTVQTQAKLRHLRISPRKVRLIIDAIRGKKVAAAIRLLENSSKHAALPVLKLLKSAMANATHNHNMTEASLVIKTATVDGGPTLHRWMPRAMGRATPIRKRTSHVTIVLEGDAPEAKAEAKKAPKKVEKTEKKETAEKKEEKKPAKKASKK